MDEDIDAVVDRFKAYLANQKAEGIEPCPLDLDIEAVLKWIEARKVKP